MRWNKIPQKAAKTTEIRIRELDPTLAKKLVEIGMHYRESRAAVLVVKVINDWKDAQDSIKQLQARNTELHKAIAVYHSRENNAKEIVSDLQYEMKTMQNIFKESEKRMAGLLAQYTKRAAAKKKPIVKPKKRK